MKKEEEPSVLDGLSVVKKSTGEGLPWVLEYRDVEALLDEAISEDSPAPYGAVLWNSSVVAARWLLGRNLRGQRVLDLGAGNGLCALTASLLGADSKALDVDANVLKLVAGAATAQHLVVATGIFDVFDDVKLPSCDLLIVADVLYEPELARRVADNVVAAHKNGSAVLVVDPQRYSRKIFSQRLFELGLDVSFVDDSYHLDARDQEIGLLWLEP
ncbi:MAG: methyltransferase [Deltaproteobacteria bacterium]|nr:methyltransferase [Deltaproteobacteria bacterium]